MILLVSACLAAPEPPFRLVEVAAIEGPTAIAEPPSGPRGIWVTEQAGRVWRVDEGGARVVLDLRDRVVSGGERGLLGLAFHPRWPEDPRLFVNYTRKDGGLRTRIASFRPTAAASETEVLSFDQPWSNHNSGSLVFGPDGMLYAGVGDGGSGGDPRGTGQVPSDLLGSILRLDVSAAPYRVPDDNPLVGRDGARPEVWAYGLRNPWGMHFDGATLWFADVGQDRWEEMNRGVPGGNYGWNVKEGSHCFRESPCPGDFVEPVAEYGHDLGQSITGGPVYRGPSIPALDGKAIFADFATGRIWTVPATGGPKELVADTDLMVSTFGTDRDGRLYVGDYRGKVYRVDRR